MPAAAVPTSRRPGGFLELIRSAASSWMERAPRGKRTAFAPLSPGQPAVTRAWAPIIPAASTALHTDAAHRTDAPHRDDHQRTPQPISLELPACAPQPTSVRRPPPLRLPGRALTAKGLLSLTLPSNEAELERSAEREELRTVVASSPDEDARHAPPSTRGVNRDTTLSELSHRKRRPGGRQPAVGELSHRSRRPGGRKPEGQPAIGELSHRSRRPGGGSRDGAVRGGNSFTGEVFGFAQRRVQRASRTARTSKEVIGHAVGGAVRRVGRTSKEGSEPPSTGHEAAEEGRADGHGEETKLEAKPSLSLPQREPSSGVVAPTPTSRDILPHANGPVSAPELSDALRQHL